MRSPTPDDHATLRASLAMAALVLAGFGFLYSLGGALLGRAAFPRQATGSVVMVEGRARGSALVAQPFADPRYFQARPSAANYDPMAAAGSNLARSNPQLRERIHALAEAVARREGVAPARVPGELVTQSGGGLDPHLSPAGASVQVARVAAARGLPVAAVRALVAAHTEGPQLGILGRARVNVLELNLALDASQRR